MQGGRISQELKEKQEFPIMVEVKAPGWKENVWKQLVAEIAAWIYETTTPDDSTNANKADIMHRKVMFTQHGAQIYLIVGFFGNDYLR
ncbi:hypothetical protein PG991_000910 [Apiospora marii]|uniref:Uncharacterized protein n=1 Tax=Apiospora marii TaxID=335849 RepID=A0ABR1SV38_9PEZI